MTDITLTDIRTFLAGRTDRWTTKETIAQSFLPEHVNPRTIAALAMEADGEIISTGKGYKLAKWASEQDILDAYREIMRKAIGSEKRARRIIHYSRRHGLLKDHQAPERITSEIRAELAKDPSNDPQPQHMEKKTKAQQQTFL